MRSLRPLPALAAFASAWILLGCPQFPTDVCEEITCLYTDGGADGSQPLTDGAPGADGGHGDSGPDVPPCVSTRSVEDAPCVVDDAFGIFVSDATGVDGNAGTRAAPKKTIGAALLAAQAARKRVFVCEGTYAENLVIDTSKDGARISGGLACATWTYDAAMRPIVKPATGIALRLTQVSDVVIEDVAFTARDGAGPGQSSVAVFATSTNAGVVLRRVALTAGKGVNGANGDPGATPVSTPVDRTGAAAPLSTGAGPTSCTCSTGGTSQGGKGGDASGTAQAGLPAIAENPSGHNGAGGQPNASCGGTGIGTFGADAVAAADRAGAATTGTLTAGGWVPASGLGGAAGTPGQGGGGGGGVVTGGGGSGGCGGCGGGAGGGGSGGGASIALLAIDAKMVLVESSLATAKAGDGGAGVLGVDGQLGGRGGGSLSACSGGDGGRGAKGGAGGGGAGGISVGVVHKGTASPLLDTATTVTVPATAFGAAGSGGKATNPGIVGVAQADLALP